MSYDSPFEKKMRKNKNSLRVPSKERDTKTIHKTICKGTMVSYKREKHLSSMFVQPNETHSTKDYMQPNEWEDIGEELPVVLEHSWEKPISAKVSHQQSEIQTAMNWAAIIDELSLQWKIVQYGVKHNCFECEKQHSVVCMNCNQKLCHEHYAIHESQNPLHIFAEGFHCNNVEITIPKLRPPNCVCFGLNITSHKVVTLYGIKSVGIHVCKDQSLVASLIRLKLWPITPVHPQYSFEISLMELAFNYLCVSKRSITSFWSLIRVTWSNLPVSFVKNTTGTHYSKLITHYS